MTVEEWNKLHGPNWSRFKQTAMFKDLKILQIVSSPSAVSHRVPASEATQNAPYMIGSQAGHARLWELIEGLGTIEVDNSPPDTTFSEQQ